MARYDTHGNRIEETASSGHESAASGHESAAAQGERGVAPSRLKGVTVTLAVRELIALGGFAVAGLGLVFMSAVAFSTGKHVANEVSATLSVRKPVVVQEVATSSRVSGADLSASRLTERRITPATANDMPQVLGADWHTNVLFLTAFQDVPLMPGQLKATELEQGVLQSFTNSATPLVRDLLYHQARALKMAEGQLSVGSNAKFNLEAMLQQDVLGVSLGARLGPLKSAWVQPDPDVSAIFLKVPLSDVLCRKFNERVFNVDMTAKRLGYVLSKSKGWAMAQGIPFCATFKSVNHIVFYTNDPTGSIVQSLPTIVAGLK